jgi:hypothetical protein
MNVDIFLTRPLSFISGNICFEFSVQCISSAALRESVAWSTSRCNEKWYVEFSQRSLYFINASPLRLNDFIPFATSINVSSGYCPSGSENLTSCLFDVLFACSRYVNSREEWVT